MLILLFKGYHISQHFPAHMNCVTLSRQFYYFFHFILLDPKDPIKNCPLSPCLHEQIQPRIFLCLYFRFLTFSYFFHSISHIPSYPCCMVLSIRELWFFCVCNSVFLLHNIFSCPGQLNRWPCQWVSRSDFWFQLRDFCETFERLLRDFWETFRILWETFGRLFRHFWDTFETLLRLFGDFWETEEWPGQHSQFSRCFLYNTETIQLQRIHIWVAN